MSIINRSRRLLRDKQGNAIIELAIAFPVLLLLVFGAADFARLFYNAVTVSDASYAGSFYGALRGVNSALFSEMETIARQSAKDIDKPGSLTVVSDRFCDCPANPATGPNDPNAVSCITGACPGYGPPRVYVRTEVANKFDAIAHFPGIPGNINIRRFTYIRVQ